MTRHSAQHYLREFIQTGALRAGDIIDVSEISRRLDIDKFEVSLAAANLEAFGLLDRIGDKYQVRTLEKEALVDFMKMRMDIEIRVSETLAMTVTDESLGRLRSEMDIQRFAAKMDLRVKFMEASANFHARLAEEANFLHGARVLRTWEDFQQIVGMRALERPEGMREAIAEHEALLEFVEAGDANGAGESMRRHLQKTLDRLLVPVNA